MGNLVIDLPGGIARSNSTLDRLQEKNNAASRLKSRLENVIRKRLQNPRGRCVSKNIELEDLNALKWSKSLPEMRKCLIRRVEKMYTFCHEQKAQKAKSIISRVVKNLEDVEESERENCIEESKDYELRKTRSQLQNRLRRNTEILPQKNQRENTFLRTR